MRPSHYSLFSRTVHWLTAILMIGMFYTGFTFFEGFPGPVPGGVPGALPPMSPWSRIPLHKAMGFTILVLAVSRIVYRLLCKVPALPAGLPAFQAKLARGVQFMIYALLITQPLSGWLGPGHTFSWFGVFTMPEITTFTPYRLTLQSVHHWGAWALIGLISLHTLGALYHHYVRKDHVLVSMLLGSSGNSNQG